MWPEFGLQLSLPTGSYGIPLFGENDLETHPMGCYQYSGKAQLIFSSQYQHHLLYGFMNDEKYSPLKLTGCKLLLALPKLTLAHVPWGMITELLDQLLRILKFCEPQAEQSALSAHFLWVFSFAFTAFTSLLTTWITVFRTENLLTRQLSSRNTRGHELFQDTEWESQQSRTESEPRCYGTEYCLFPAKFLLEFGFHCSLVGSWGDEALRRDECLLLRALIWVSRDRVSCLESMLLTEQGCSLCFPSSEHICLSICCHELLAQYNQTWLLDSSPSESWATLTLFRCKSLSSEILS